MSVKFLLTIAKIHNLDTKVIDFVLAFPQAKLTNNVYIENYDGHEVQRRSQRRSACLLRSEIELQPLRIEKGKRQLV